MNLAPRQITLFPKTANIFAIIWRYNFKPNPKLHKDEELDTGMPPLFSCAYSSRITHPT